MIKVRILAGAAVLGWGPATQAEPTPVSVYVLSQDAKFVGSSVGGARVTITEAAGGELLAQGVTTGDTGDTDLIMRTDRKRDGSIVTDDTARFSATLDLDRPTRVVVTAYGPLDFPESANTVSASYWVLPGQNLTEANGWILDLPGLVVDLQDPAPAPLVLEQGRAELAVRANVTMMCGCEITPDGLWPTSDYRVQLELLRDGEPVAEQAMGYAGEPSEYAGRLTISEPGRYEVRVKALQPRTGNAGLARASIWAR